MKKNIFFGALISTCMLALLSSCHDSKKSKPAMKSVNNDVPSVSTLESPPEIPLPPDATPVVVIEDNLEKLETETYLAVLSPVNPGTAGQVTGAFTLFKDRDFMVSDIRVTGAAPNIIHAQNMHLGYACPTASADLNLDGIIDVLEAQQFSGKIIIPLDADINNQYSMLGMFPVGDAWGSYFYSQSASFQSFVEDLRGEDENVDDEIVKIGTTTLSLAGRVILIHGVADETALPETVGTHSDLSANQTLPVACGVLSKVTSVPGIFEPDDRVLGTTRSGDDTPGVRPRPGYRRPARPSRPDEVAGTSGRRSSPFRSRNGTGSAGSGTGSGVRTGSGTSSTTGLPCPGEIGKDC